MSRNSLKHWLIKLFLDSQKSKLLNLRETNISLCTTYCKSYAFKPLGGSLKNRQFLGLPYILIPQNIYTVRASKLTLKITIWREFSQRIVSDNTNNKQHKLVWKLLKEDVSQPAFTCSKLATETPEKGVKYAQS